MKINFPFIILIHTSQNNQISMFNLKVLISEVMRFIFGDDFTYCFMEKGLSGNKVEDQKEDCSGEG